MISKKQIKIAKSLFKNSLDSQGIVSHAKVKVILAQLAKEKIVGTVAILKVYKRQVQNAIRHEEVTVESALDIKNNHLISNLIKKTGAKRINFKIHPNITFGAKITSGDWVYDATLDAKLKRLTIND